MSMETDLTRGSIPRQLIRYALPLIGSSVLQAAYGIVDMIVAGQFIGSAGLSGITNATTVITLLTQIIFGLCTGGCILVGQYYGAKDRENCRSAATTLYTMGLAIGIIFAVVLFLLSGSIIRLLKAPALQEAGIYMRTCCVGLIFVAGYNATSAALRAIGNSRAPLVCIIATSAVNIVLDILFVLPLNMGVFGAALATIIAQAISFLVALFFVVRSRDVLGIHPLHFRLDRVKLFKEAQLGLPCVAQETMVAISWLSITYLLNSHGIAASAASGVATKTKDLAQLFIVSAMNAAATMVAQNLGAGEYERAKQTTMTALKLTIAAACVLILITECFAPQLVACFTREADTAALAVLNLRIEIIGQIFYAVFLTYHALMIGAGTTWYVFLSAFINCIPVRITLAFLLNHFFGISGLFTALMLAPASSIPFCLWYYRSDRWKTNAIKQ